MPSWWSVNRLLSPCYWSVIMLGQGCFRALFLENYLFALKVGLRWVFVNGLKWVQKWVKSGFSGAKVGQNASKPTFPPT